MNPRSPEILAAVEKINADSSSAIEITEYSPIFGGYLRRSRDRAKPQGLTLITPERILEIAEGLE